MYSCIVSRKKMPDMMISSSSLMFLYFPGFRTLEQPWLEVSMAMGPKWMVYFMENPMKKDDWGYPYLRKPPVEGCDTGSMLLPEAADLHSVLSAIEAFADGRKWLKAMRRISIGK